MDSEFSQYCVDHSQVTVLQTIETTGSVKTQHNVAFTVFSYCNVGTLKST